MPATTSATGARARRGAVLTARIAVSGVALWLAFARTDLSEVARVVTTAGALPFLGTLAIYLASQVISAMRWLLIARRAGFVLHPHTAMKYYFIGMFFNFLGPSLIGGDLARSLYLAGGRQKMARAAVTVALDRYVGFVWLAAIGSGALLTFGRFSLPVNLVWATHGLAAVALASWFLLPRTGVLTRGWWSLREVGSRAALMSLVFHVLQIAGTIVLVRFVAPETPWRYCFVFHPLVAIVSALPISVAGLGVRESGYVYFLATLQGVPASHASAFAAVWLAVLVAASLIGGVVFLLSGGRLPFDPTQDGSTQFPASS